MRPGCGGHARRAQTRRSFTIAHNVWSPHGPQHGGGYSRTRMVLPSLLASYSRVIPQGGRRVADDTPVSNETSRLWAADPSRYIDTAGCGNSVNTGHRMALRMIMDSLRYGSPRSVSTASVSTWHGRTAAATRPTPPTPPTTHTAAPTGPTPPPNNPKPSTPSPNITTTKETPPPSLLHRDRDATQGSAA